MAARRRKRKTPPVELHPGFWFYCHACGERNFLTILRRTATPAERKRAEAQGIDTAKTDTVTFLPDTVKCSQCTSEFRCEYEQ